MRHEQILPFYAQILDGVEAAHLQEVVHRDLKPENVLYERSGNNLVIADFGIARFTEEALFTAVETRPQERLANFLYAAPEQRVRGGNITPQTDIFALGLILNELFTGQVLQGTGHKQIGSVAPQFAYLDELVDLMVRNSADERPLSISKVKQELIARGNDFVSLQRLNELKNAVVPETQIDDPIVTDPITLVGIDCAAGGILMFQLNRKPPVEWVRNFQNLKSYSALVGCEPYRFTFERERAVVHVPGDLPGQAQILTNHVKDYIQAANQQYKSDIISAQKQQIERQRRVLREDIEQREKLQRIRESIKSVKF